MNIKMHKIAASAGIVLGIALICPSGAHADGYARLKHIFMSNNPNSNNNTDQLAFLDGGYCEISGNYPNYNKLSLQAWDAYKNRVTFWYGYGATQQDGVPECAYLQPEDINQ